MGGTTAERDLFANRFVAFLIACAVFGLLVFGMAGCGTVAHWGGLSTTDDVRAERDDQAAIDKKVAEVEKRTHAFMVNAIADVLEGKTTPADMVNAVAAYLAHDELTPVFDAAVARTYQRTAPPPTPVPSSPTDWPAIGGAVAALILAALAHQKGSANTKQIEGTKRSLQETDDWVHEVDVKKADKPGAP